jgi:hypothetical protein
MIGRARLSTRERERKGRLMAKTGEAAQRGGEVGRWGRPCGRKGPGWNDRLGKKRRKKDLN